MTANSPYAAPIAAPALVRTTAALLPLTVGLGVAALVAAIVNGVFGAMFPSNAPVEQIYCFGITVDLVAVAIGAAIRALVLFRRPRGESNRRLSVFGIIAAALAVLVFVGWLLLGGVEYWTGGMSRYMTGAGPLFFLGALWVVAVLFGEVAARRSDTPLNSALAIGALALSAVVGITSVAATVIYGLGLSA